MVLRFFADRQACRVPLATVLWRDMVVVASAINIAFIGAAVIALEMGVPTALAVAIFFAPLPYNIFLWSAVWRISAHSAQPERATARTIATVWLLLATLL